MKLKSWDYFMNDFGAELAPMQTRRPDVAPKGPADLSVARVSARSSGQSGFLFVNNHVRGEVMPARPGFQVEVKLPEGKTVMLPEKPVDLPADSYFVWPFGMDLNGLKLRYATAQPLAKLRTEKEPVYAFFAQPGIAPEFVVENTPGIKFVLSLGSTGGVETRDGVIRFAGLHPERQRGDSIRFTLSDGRHVTLLLLDQTQAEQAWRVQVGGTTALVATPQQAFVDGTTMTLENLGGKEFRADVIPETALRLVPEDAKVKAGHSGADLTATASSAVPVTLTLQPSQTKQAGEVAPLPEGFKPSGRPRVVAGAPTDADWSRAAVWTIPLPKPSADPGTKQFLSIRYTGDVARLSVGGKLLDDNFADGRPWLVGLTRFTSAIAGKPLEFSIYPLRKDPPVFFEPGLEPKVDGTQVDRLDSLELVDAVPPAAEGGGEALTRLRPSSSRARRRAARGSRCRVRVG